MTQTQAHKGGNPNIKKAQKIQTAAHCLETHQLNEKANKVPFNREQREQSSEESKR